MITYDNDAWYKTINLDIGNDDDDDDDGDKW